MKPVNLTLHELHLLRLSISTRISTIERYFVTEDNLPEMIDYYIKEIDELEKLHKKLNEQT